MGKVWKAACRGCHGGCMYLVTVEQGRVVQVRPDPEGPLNHGRGCVKGMSIIEQMYHKDRLLYPMRRIGPGRRPMTRSPGNSGKFGRRPVRKALR